MAEFHFVEDYERHVEALLEAHPIDEAMSLAVGGLYETVGAIESNLLRYLGLREHMSITDLGCGSGRLANALSKALTLNYIGIDIVQSLLNYAATRSSDPTSSYCIAN
jgi:methylase of polypeptide subunit release factors